MYRARFDSRAAHVQLVALTSQHSGYKSCTWHELMHERSLNTLPFARNVSRLARVNNACTTVTRTSFRSFVGRRARRLRCIRLRYACIDVVERLYGHTA